MIAVGMRLAGKHLGDDHMLKTAFYGFDLFHSLDLEAGESEQVVKLLGRHIAQVNIFL